MDLKLYDKKQSVYWELCYWPVADLLTSSGQINADRRHSLPSAKKNLVFRATVLKIKDRVGSIFF